MRIAMVFSSDPSTAGGVQEQLLSLQNSLLALGHQVDIFGPAKNIFPFKSYTEISVIKPIPLPNGNVANYTVAMPETDAILKKIQKNYDLVHLHEPYIGLVAWKLISTLNLPLVTTFHAGWNKGSVMEFLQMVIAPFQAIFSQRVQEAIFVSQLGKENWGSLCNGKVGKTVIPLGIGSEFSPPNIVKTIKQPWKLLFVARLVSRKGLQYLPPLIKILKDEGIEVKLEVIGRGPMLAEVKKLALKLGVSRSIEFLGELHGAQKIAHFHAADFFMAPYTDEAFGLTLLEAMAAGCPPIGFNNDAFADTIDQCPVTPLTVAYGDVNQLAKKLKFLATHPKTYTAVREWGFKFCAQFDWAEIAKKTVKVYQKAINRFQSTTST